MTLSVIIVNWNEKILTENCINSIISARIKKIDQNEIEIIVIDNGSADGSLEYLKSKNRFIKLMGNEKNEGYAPACNRGMRGAQGKYILLLGNDTIVLNDTLEKCISFLNDNIDCGAVGCKLLNPDRTAQNNCKKFPKLKNGFYTYLSLDSLNRDYDMDRFKYDETRQVEQISTTFLMIRKDVLEKIGYFDESYKILYNDVDLCKKIWDTGFKIYFLHTAEIVHYGSQSTKKAGFMLRKIMYKDIYRYYRSNFGIKALTLVPVLFIRLLLTAVIKR
jgi:O-antigen biosynthesis protein